MKKVLYLSNIEVPYRVRFFNALAKHCDLTVWYESRAAQQRNVGWAKSEPKHCRVIFSAKDLPWTPFDRIILGCCHTPRQMLAGLTLRLLGIPYIINLDGEPFLKGNSVKARGKRFFLSGASEYLVAGEKAAQTLRTAAGEKKIISYPFSSLWERELAEHREAANCVRRTDTILVVGQYFPYKGMDVALEAARQAPDLRFRFVGMGRRTERFAKEHRIPENVEVIPFLQKRDLEREYQSCALLVLPSRRECWGLVIHEAASFGTPIVSTWGSGAAVEFLSEEYPQYLAEPGNAEDLLRCIRRCLSPDGKEPYSVFLLKKAARYSIERSVQAHLPLLEEEG